MSKCPHDSDECPFEHNEDEQNCCTDVSAENFYLVFAKQMKIACTKNDWQKDYSSNSRWTDFMLGNVLIKVAKALGYKTKNSYATEYMLIDVGYFNTTKSECFWDFDIAIEHENNGGSWLEEFVKLFHLNCGLKVIITYNKDGDTKAGDKLFNRAMELYNSRKYRDGKENWLIIIGPSFKQLHEGLDYKSYTLKIDNNNQAQFVPFPTESAILQD